MSAHGLRFTALGGVGRFGRNCLLVECDDAAIVIDCGARFVSQEAPGFDVGLPDVARIDALGHKLLAYVVTHGHEDHIGALPYAAMRNPQQILTTPYTARLVARRFDRIGVKLPDIHIAPFDTDVVVGPFTIRFLAVSHSIPDASCLVVRTPNGSFVHSGDFRVDEAPVLGPPTDMAGLARAGDVGVDVLFADSTGAQLEGHNSGERSVYAPLLAAVQGAVRRVVVAQFASHIQRLALVAQAARACGRKVALLGRGVQEHHRIASDLQMLALDDVLVREGQLLKLPRDQQLWVATGTQGERGSGLWRLARDTGPFRLEADDRIVMSARIIPGNERAVHTLLDAVAERGCDIVDGKRAPHVSGHGCRDDLEALLFATRPKHFIALHGDVRHLLAHKHLVTGAGLDDDHVFAMRDGSSLVHRDGVMQMGPDAPNTNEPYAINGAVLDDPGDTVATRMRMTQAGVLMVCGGAAIRLVARGIFPPLGAALQRAVLDGASAALAKAGTQDEGEACLSLARLFYRAGRSAPEIVLLPSSQTTAAEFL